MRREVRAARLEKVAQVRSQRSIAPASMQRSLESTFLARLATLSRYSCRACTLGPRNRFSARTLVWVVAPPRLKPRARHVPVQGLTGALEGTEPVFVVAGPAHGPRAEAWSGCEARTASLRASSQRAARRVCHAAEGPSPLALALFIAKYVCMQSWKRRKLKGERDDRDPAGWWCTAQA